MYIYMNYLGLCFANICTIRLLIDETVEWKERLYPSWLFSKKEKTLIYVIGSYFNINFGLCYY